MPSLLFASSEFRCVISLKTYVVKYFFFPFFFLLGTSYSPQENSHNHSALHSSNSHSSNPSNNPSKTSDGVSICDQCLSPFINIQYFQRYLKWETCTSSFIEFFNISFSFINTLSIQAAVVKCCKTVLIDNRQRFELHVLNLKCEIV